MDEPCDERAPGVVRLPSGRLVPGRALRRPVPPQWALHLRSSPGRRTSLRSSSGSAGAG